MIVFLLVKTTVKTRVIELRVSDRILLTLIFINCSTYRVSRFKEVLIGVLRKDKRLDSYDGNVYGQGFCIFVYNELQK